MSGLRGAGYWVCGGVGGVEGRGGYVGGGRFKSYSFRRVSICPWFLPFLG